MKYFCAQEKLEKVVKGTAKEKKKEIKCTDVAYKYLGTNIYIEENLKEKT